MAKTKKVVNALSISALAGIMASTVLSSAAFAAVDAYSVKVGDNVFEYNTTELQESFLASKAGDEAVLYNDFAAKLEEAKGFYAFHDAKTNRYIAFDNVTNAFLGDRENFKLNDYVEADKAVAVTNLPTVIKSVKVVGGEIKLEDKNTGTVVSEELEVKSVTANNLKEIKIEFNKAVTMDASKLSDYFAVKNGTNDVAILQQTVSTDKKVVTLTLAGTIGQQSSLEVTAKKALGLAEEKVSTITMMDVIIPTADSVKLTGPKTFDITFSEPIKAVPTVEVENGIYGIDSANTALSTDGRVLTVTLSSNSLVAGNYNVKVSGFQDYADFKGMTKTFVLDYVKDETAPTVSLKSASQTTVKVEFNKEVIIPVDTVANAARTQAQIDAGLTYVKTEYLYHTYSAWRPYSVTTTDNKVFTLSFNDGDNNTVDPILPEGNITVTVLSSASDVAIEDAWGNEMAADAKLVAPITIDKVAPTVTEVSSPDENKVKVTFSEDVNVAAANFEIKDSEGKKVAPAITGVSFDSDKLVATITLGADLDGGNYTVTVKNVTDKALAANKIVEVTKAFTVTDSTALNLSNTVITVVDNATAKVQYLYVTFEAKVATTGVNSALNKDNYTIDNAPLSSDAKVEIFGTTGTRVKITVPYSGDPAAKTVTPGTSVVNIGRVADISGNVPSALATTVATADDVAPTTFTVKAVDTNKLVLTFAGELSTVSADGIKVDGKDADAVTSTLAAVSYEVKDGKTYVTATLRADECLADKTAASLAAMKVEVVDNKLKTITGQTLSSVASVTGVADGIAPAQTGDIVLARASANTATIAVTFDEALKAGLIPQLVANDFIIKDSTGKVYVPYVNYTVAIDDVNAPNTIVFTLTFADEAALDKLNGTKFTVATKDVVNYTTDANDNAIKVFADKLSKATLADN